MKKVIVSIVLFLGLYSHSVSAAENALVKSQGDDKKMTYIGLFTQFRDWFNLWYGRRREIKQSEIEGIFTRILQTQDRYVIGYVTNYDTDNPREKPSDVD